jgi:predicted outer membrane repeat protein
MQNYSSSPTLNNCTFTSNLAVGDDYSSGSGGGMRNTMNSAPTIVNCTFSQNSAQSGGGGLHSSHSSDPAISDSIFCENTPENIAGDYTDNGGICLADTCDDSNGNGIPDECEPPDCPWDLDGTGVVGASDLLALLVSWGPCKGCPADFDGNGTVGASDLLALLVNWGPCP